MKTNTNPKQPLAPLSLFLWLIGFCLQSANAIESPTSNAQVVGKEIEEALNARDLPSLTKLVDVRELSMRVAQDLKIAERGRASFAEAFSRGSGNTLLQQIIDGIDKSEGDAKLMRVVQREDGPHPIIRLDYGDNGFDYFEFVLAKDKGGQFRAVDWIALTNGELTSRVIGSASRLLVDPDPGFLQTLLGGLKPDVNLTAQFRAIGELRKEGKYREALALLNKLPPEIQEAKVLVFLRVNLASVSDDDNLYREALDMLARLHGHDPAAAALLLDYYVLAGKVDEALKGLTFIETRVGQDGLTESMKAIMMSSAKRYDEMLKYAVTAVRLEDDRPRSYAILANAQVLNAKFEDAVQTYRRLEDKFGAEFTATDFADDEAAQKFVQSAPYKNWMKSKKNKSAP